MVAGEVHRSASEDSLAKEVPSALRMSDERVGYVALRAEIEAVCMLDRGHKEMKHQMREG